MITASRLPNSRLATLLLALALVAAGCADDDGDAASNPSTTSVLDTTTTTTTVADESTTTEATVDAPEPPVDIEVIVDGSDVELRWMHPNGRADLLYLVERDGETLDTVPGTSYLDSDLEDGAYWYRVFAVNANDEAADAVTVIAQVGAVDAFPPSDPTGVTIEVVDGKVVIDWNASQDDRGVRGYLIHRNRDFYAYIDDSLRFVDDDVEEGFTYRYRVRAQDDAGNHSAPVGGIVTLGPPDTQAPTVPVVDEPEVSGTTVTITWKPATDDREIWGYLVHRDGVFHEWVDDKTEFSEQVEPGSSHEYVIRSQDGAGNNSDPSDPIDVTVS